jgi:lipopolysaccharide biosynthesis regulator YciM
MAEFWVSGAFSDGGQNLGGSNRQTDVTLQVRDLEHEVKRLMLMNQALWELLRERLHLTDADLERKSTEVDLRDGVKDGAVTTTPLKCPTCGRVSSSRYWKCLYCGQEFEKPAMG